MPTEIVRPNSKLNSAWGLGNTHLSVDDVVTQPSAGSGDVVALDYGSTGAVQQYGCASPSNTGTITSAKIWVYRATDSNSDSEISSARIRLNGTWYSTGAFSGSFNGATYGWISATATGSYGSMSTSSPAVELTFTAATVDGTMDVDVIYLEITYTANIYGPNIAQTGSDAGAAWTTPGNITANDSNFAVWSTGDTPAGCFLENTRILTPYGEKFIQDLKIGDQVYDINMNIVQVQKIHQIIAEQYLMVCTNNEIVYVTKDHPFAYKTGYLPIHAIEIGEVISDMVIINKVEILGPVEVYNLSVDGSNTFIANNFKVHNK